MLIVKTAQNDVASKFEKTFTSSNGTEGGRTGWKDAFNENASPDQMKKASATATHMLSSRVEAYNNGWDHAMRGAADTLSFGLDNDIAAAGDALFNPVFGKGHDGGSFSERYDKDLNQQRGIDAADGEHRSGYRLGGQIAGGLAQGVGLAKNGLSLTSKALEAEKGLMKVAGASALDFGGLGAAQGFGSGEGGFENCLEKNLSSALLLVWGWGSLPR